MKRKQFLSAVLVLLALVGFAKPAFAQDKIEGFWFNEEKSAKVKIYKAVDGKFWGVIVWLKEPVRDGKPRVDDKNPKEKFRNTPLINLPVLRGFKKDGEDYDGGQIYDPKNGKTYDCNITYRNANELGIRGYVGVSLLGRTTTWTRTTN